MRRIPILAAALAAVISSHVAAEVPITLNLGAGYWYFDGDRKVDDTATPWGSIEYAFNDKWATELFYAEDETDYRRGGPEADIATWNLNMLYYGGSYINSAGKIRPFLSVGAGEVDIDAGDFDSVDTTVNLGVGLRWMFTDRFGARLETRMLHSLDEDSNDFLMLAGLNYYFGKVASDPVPVVAAAPVDSDGDGVFDDTDRCPNTPQGTQVDQFGCALPPPSESLEVEIDFAFDSAEVQSQYSPQVAELAEFLKRHGSLDADIEGHTDSMGAEDYNQQLSQRRAQALVDLLVSDYGIAADRLTARGYGESRPVASNDTLEGRAQNRRVMTTLKTE
ncbi:MAG: OmpA family protein [Halioglobus sp.]